jgi:hypothetical protein
LTRLTSTNRKHESKTDETFSKPLTLVQQKIANAPPKTPNPNLGKETAAQSRPIVFRLGAVAQAYKPSYLGFRKTMI